MNKTQQLFYPFVCVCVWARVTLLPHTYKSSSEYVAADVCVQPAVAFMSLYAPLLALGLSFLDSLGSFKLTRAGTR